MLKPPALGTIVEWPLCTCHATGQWLHSAQWKCRRVLRMVTLNRNYYGRWYGRNNVRTVYTFAYSVLSTLQSYIDCKWHSRIGNDCAPMCRADNVHVWWGKTRFYYVHTNLSCEYSFELGTACLISNPTAICNTLYSCLGNKYIYTVQYLCGTCKAWLHKPCASATSKNKHTLKRMSCGCF